MQRIIVLELQPCREEQTQADKQRQAPHETAKRRELLPAAQPDVNIVVDEAGHNVSPRHNVQGLGSETTLVARDDGGGEEPESLIAIVRSRLDAREELFLLWQEVRINHPQEVSLL